MGMGTGVFMVRWLEIIKLGLEGDREGDGPMMTMGMERWI